MLCYALKHCNSIERTYWKVQRDSQAWQIKAYSEELKQPKQQLTLGCRNIVPQPNEVIIFLLAALVRLHIKFCT